jgi:hypothetical protein
MDSNGHPHSDSRGKLLGVLLALLAVAAIVGFALVILSPFLAVAIGAVVIVVMMVGFGFLHYWLWGRSMSQEVAGEREEEELRPPADVDEWPPASPAPRRRF